MERIILFFSCLALTHFSYSYAGILSKNEIESARSLGKSSIKFSDFINHSSNTDNRHWLTIEEFNFIYKKKPQSFTIANSYETDGWSGNIALYPSNPLHPIINLATPSILEGVENNPYLSRLHYKHYPDKSPYFIITYVDTDPKFAGKGYSQACLDYFLTEFVMKRTDVNFILTDLRAPETQHYFPQFGFIQGKIDNFTFTDMENPYYWIRKKEYK